MTADPEHERLPQSHRRAPLDIVEGLYVSKITEFLHLRGVFRRLEAGATAGDLCEEFGFDRDAISALLEFIYQRTTLLQREQAKPPTGETAGTALQPASPHERAARYTFDAQYRAHHDFGFHIEKFLTAYGPVLGNLSDCVMDPGRGPKFIDRAAFGHAFDQLDVGPNSIVRQIVQDLGVKSVLELGCGTGQGLAALAQADEQMNAVGIEEDSGTCALASERMSASGLADRVEIRCGDATRILELSKDRPLPDVECVYSRGFLNSLFWPGDERAVACLSDLSTLYPNGLLVVEDYYGRLGGSDDAPEGDLQAILQDVVQVLTAQGVPPPTRSAWAATYAKAGCTLFHAFEGHSAGLPWFVHLVRLGDPKAPRGREAG